MKTTPWYEKFVYRTGNDPKSMLMWLMAPLLMAILYFFIPRSSDHDLLVVAFIGIVFLGVERWAFAKVIESKDREIAALKKLR
jgi:hypothetical protein